MIGPPGVGKSLLAQAMIGILPALALPEAIEITKIYSAAGLSPGGLIKQRPFRSPHQTASIVAVVGGGSDPKPGEISLAHRGILFLDELPEFQKNILEALRQPMESGTVHVARAKGTLIFPAKFTLVAAMNPCPCGFYGDPEKECKCTAYEVIRYQKKISGPLLDRIDLQIKVPRVKIAELRGKAPTLRPEASEVGVPTASRVGKKFEPASPAIKKQVEHVRKIQAERFAKLSASRRIQTNSEMSSRQAEEMISFAPGAEKFLETLDRSRLSPRGYYRLLKTAQTIADLEAPTLRPGTSAVGVPTASHVGKKVSAEHLAEAFSYRLREEV
jgi:magnesium chelatase family protein